MWLEQKQRLYRNIGQILDTALPPCKGTEYRSPLPLQCIKSTKLHHMVIDPAKDAFPKPTSRPHMLSRSVCRPRKLCRAIHDRKLQSKKGMLVEQPCRVGEGEWEGQRPCAGGFACAWWSLKQHSSRFVVCKMAASAFGNGLVHLRVQQGQQHSVLNLLLLISVPWKQQGWRINWELSVTSCRCSSLILFVTKRIKLTGTSESCTTVCVSIGAGSAAGSGHGKRGRGGAALAY